MNHDTLYSAASFSGLFRVRRGEGGWSMWERKGQPAVC
jgi:hypothetical protein